MVQWKKVTKIIENAALLYSTSLQPNYAPIAKQSLVVKKLECFYGWRSTKDEISWELSN